MIPFDLCSVVLVLDRWHGHRSVPVDLFRAHGTEPPFSVDDYLPPHLAGVPQGVGDTFVYARELVAESFTLAEAEAIAVLLRSIDGTASVEVLQGLHGDTPLEHRLPLRCMPAGSDQGVILLSEHEWWPAHLPATHGYYDLRDLPPEAEDGERERGFRHHRESRGHLRLL